MKRKLYVCKKCRHISSTTNKTIFEGSICGKCRIADIKKAK